MSSVWATPALATPRHRVVFNKPSVFFTALLVLNVVLMPLKAYISEPFPSTSTVAVAIPFDCDTNFTACAPRLLAFFRDQRPRLSSATPQLSSNEWDMFRTPFALPPPSGRVTPESYFLQLPFAIFFSSAQQALAAQVASRDINASAFITTSRASFLGLYIGYNVMWMDDSNSNENVMYTGYMRAPSSAWWLLCKLLLRLSLAGCVGVWMWHAYFQHLPRLVASLEAYGLCDAPISATLEVVVGDPTAYVLLHPMVSIAFVLDFWLSVDFVARAMNRMVQATDASSFVVACVYLSRTVWFGYGTLLAMSTVLRYCRIYRPRFVAVDPTTIAILLTLAAGPITRLQSQTPALARVYNSLFTCIAPSPDEIDVGVAALVYTLIIGVLPLLLGFVLSACARARAVAGQSLRRRSLSSLKEGPHVAMIHASFADNDWKNRIMTTLSIHPWTATFTCVGGSVYDLCDKQPKYSRNMALSLRGADCFVLYSTSNTTRTSVRLSLLSAIETQDPLRVLPGPRRSAVGKVNPTTEVVRQGSDHSPWIM